MPTINDFPQHHLNLALSRVGKVILSTLNYKEVIQKVVDSILFELDLLKLGYRIVVLALIDESQNVLKRISISQTPEAKKAVAGLPLPYNDVQIPLSAAENYCIKTMNEKRPLITHCWPDILTPPLTEIQAENLQKQVGIKTSMVYPLLIQKKPIGMMIFSMIKDEKEVTEEEKELISGFTDLVGIAVQNAELYTSVEQTTQNLRLANEKLQELDKLKDEFVSMVSHELRTPMTIIKGYISMVLEGSEKLTDKDREMLMNAYKNSDRMVALVNDMLNISRIEDGRLKISPSQFDIAQLALEIGGEFQSKANEKHIQLLVVNDKPQMVFADKERLHEVLVNLVSNALKFTPQLGKITISFKENQKEIETTVSDTGIGIKSEDLLKLFTKFGRLDNQNEEPGTGLGLYISKKIVELSGGKITVSSAPGKGTAFSFTLPKSINFVR